MTLLEKAMAEHPGLNEEKIVTWMCPCDFGYEKLDDGCGQVGAVQEICRECWNRETPSTAEAVPLPQSRQAAGDGKREEGGAGDGG